MPAQSRFARALMLGASLSAAVVLARGAVTGAPACTPADVGQDGDSTCALQTARRVPVARHGGNSSRLSGIGVNAGGWLLLEDWFFSGTTGTLVSSSKPHGQGACLPPLLTGPLETPWRSEGELTKWLQENPKRYGTASEVFKAHRESFMTEEDLDQMASNGIKALRVPLAWAAFADALKDLDPQAYGQHDPDKDTAIVPDPYYKDEISLATVPRAWLASFLKKAESKGIAVLLDIHAMPGGSSDGTYNGVWPKAPVFWSEKSKLGSSPQKLTDLGHLIFKKMLDWIAEEGLSGGGLRDGAVMGVTPMNEPGLSMSIEPRQIFDWLGGAVDIFEESKVIKSNGAIPGVSVYLNLIGMSPGEMQGFFNGFSANQKDWLVCDVHHYMAWDRGCCGTSPEGGCAYDCANTGGAIDNVERCARGYPGDFPKWPRKAATEFSMSTWNQVLSSCRTEKDILDKMLSSQVDVYAQNGVQAFFWSWKMPYGSNFQSQWSLKFHLGLETAGDASKCRAPKQIPTPVLGPHVTSMPGRR